MVLCAGAPDTPEIAAEMKNAIDTARAGRSDVIWIEEMLDKPSVIELYSHAAVFCCPSIYEPFGIINLEAMACETAVVATAVGGIKEVVVNGETGFLVPVEQMSESPFEPVDPDKFARDLAAKINQLMANPGQRGKIWSGRPQTRRREIQLVIDREGNEETLRITGSLGDRKAVETAAKKTPRPTTALKRGANEILLAHGFSQVMGKIWRQEPFQRLLDALAAKRAK